MKIFRVKPSELEQPTSLQLSFRCAPTKDYSALSLPNKSIVQKEDILFARKKIQK